MLVSVKHCRILNDECSYLPEGDVWTMPRREMRSPMDTVAVELLLPPSSVPLFILGPSMNSTDGIVRKDIVGIDLLQGSYID